MYMNVRISFELLAIVRVQGRDLLSRRTCHAPNGNARNGSLVKPYDSNPAISRPSYRKANHRAAITVSCWPATVRDRHNGTDSRIYLCIKFMINYPTYRNIRRALFGWRTKQRPRSSSKVSKPQKSRLVGMSSSQANLLGHVRPVFREIGKTKNHQKHQN